MNLALRPLLAAFALICALTALTALSAMPPAARAADAPAPRLPASYLPVPLVPQATSYSCGAAALMAVMEYWNVWDSPELDLHGPLGTTPKDGTDETMMSRYALKAGLRSEVRAHLNFQDLRDALKDGTTVIIDLQAWTETPKVDWRNDWDDGHYVVLVAMDEQYAYFMDPSAHGAYAYLPLLEFLDRWHDMDNRDGHIRRFENLGILIHGQQPRMQFPGNLIRMR